MNKFINNILAATEGKFFTVVFTKKDGTVRTMNCRTGVKKHLKGGVSTLDASKYLTVYDLQSEGYRAVNYSTIQAVTCNGVTITNNL
jgi:hypothetical protein